MRFKNGIRIQTSCIVLIIVSVLLAALVIGSAFEVSKRYDDLRVITANYIECADAAERALDASDLLTEESREFVATGDTSHIDEFFTETEVTRTRDEAYEKLRSNNANEEAIEYLDTSVQASNGLVETEKYAMALKLSAMGIDDAASVNEAFAGVELSKDDAALSAKEKTAKATDMLTNVDYVGTKQQIASDVAETLNILLAEVADSESSAGEQLNRALVVQRVSIIALLIVCVIIFVIVLMLVVNPLRAYGVRINRDERLDEVGAYELRRLASVYNRVYDEKAARREELLALAERDPLTGVLNRRAFEAAEESFVGSNMPVCLLIIDVDLFKQINDNYGHMVGDDVLRTVADLLSAQFRTGDYVARIGGDEFAVLAPGARLEYADGITRKVMAVNEMLACPSDSDMPPTSLSVGIAFSESGFNPCIAEQADKALYEVKNGTRAGYKIYSENMGVDK